MKKGNIDKIGMIAFLQLTVCVYTLSGIAAKLASGFDFLSVGFILCYGGELLALGIYAVLWQQIIRRIDLSLAYANRAIAIFWSMLWARLIFQEEISLPNIIGIVLIILGIWVVNSGD